MERFIEAIERALKAENWYAALSLALILPDICGRLESPRATSAQRFRRWWDAYMLDRYTIRVGPEEESRIFLPTRDAYALRCSMIHEGRDDIEQQNAREVLKRFAFIVPMTEEGSWHRNRHGPILQLQVDLFCKEICEGAREWIKATADSVEVRERMAALITIYDPRYGTLPPGFATGSI